MGDAPNHIAFERELIEKVSSGKLDKAVDHWSDFETIV
jgi:hypothetical protein